MLNTPFSPWPSFTQEEADAVHAVLLSNKVNYWTGQEGRTFEKEFASWCAANHAVAVSNGTVALDLALEALGVGAGDEVIVTPRTFIASISSVVNAGATPIFADIDPQSGNITPETAKKVLTQRTKAVVCVHLAGWPCDMDGFMALAAQHDLFIIEDCAQAHGTLYKGKPVGAIGHIGAWSFCQDKIMSTGGEGGMVTTNDETLWRKIWSFKDHGKSYQAVYERDHAPGFRWLHERFGTNWRMPEMQAAIGRIQLRRMTDWQAKRHDNAQKILASCAKFPDYLDAPLCASEDRHAFYKCYVYIRPENLPKGWNRDKVIEAITAQDVPCFSGSCSEVYLEKAFDAGDLRPKNRLPEAKKLGETSLMFLVHPTLTQDEIAKTCAAIETVFSEL